MQRQLFILLITILTQSSCENSSSNSHEVKTSNPKKIETTVNLESEPIVDSITQEDQDSIKVIEKAPALNDTTAEKKESKQESKAINIKDALDVNKHRNVRDDPDYIGTPCEYVNGECIRHDHDNQDQPR